MYDDDEPDMPSWLAGVMIVLTLIAYSLPLLFIGMIIFITYKATF